MTVWKRIIALSKIKLIDDTKKTQVAQLDLGPRLPAGEAEIHDGAYVLNPYGITSNPPIGADAVVLFLNAERSLALVTGVNFKDGRPTGLESGEAALFNAVTGTLIKMSADGKAHMNCDLVVDGAISATGTIQADGAISSKSTVTARSDGTPAELGAVRDAYVAHKHPETGTITQLSDHITGV